ncbi:hypothetical protein ACQKDS_09010 [Serratia sp. NPDC078593]|uniref:hypothetical protein n=1 Tax=unclassified Serratia (in: enterobacteria) TaxID=2647522 RepID=UPI0037CE5A8B
MRELSKVEMQEVSGAGLIGDIFGTLGKVTDLAVNTVAGMIGNIAGNIGNSIGSIIGMGMGFFDNIGKIFNNAFKPAAPANPVTPPKE